MSWPWLVNDPGGGRALEPILLAVNRWRLPLLFFVSGAAATLSLRRRTWLEFAHERVQRLFLPLGVGVFLICPPQTWVERIVHGHPMSYRPPRPLVAAAAGAPVAGAGPRCDGYACGVNRARCAHSPRPGWET